MAKRVALLVVALICFTSRSLTSTISSRLFMPSSLPTHALPALSRPLHPAAAGASAASWPLRPARPGAFYSAAEGSPGDRGLNRSAVSLAVATVALALCGLTRPVATCATGGYDESGMPADCEWIDENDNWNHDMDMLKDHLEDLYVGGETQCYADSDVPSDVEFSHVFEHKQHVQRTEVHPLHHAFGLVENMFKTAIHSWKPDGFPFHHFPAAKGAIDFSAPRKNGTP